MSTNTTTITDTKIIRTNLPKLTGTKMLNDKKYDVLCLDNTAFDLVKIIGTDKQIKFYEYKNETNSFIETRSLPHASPELKGLQVLGLYCKTTHNLIYLTHIRLHKYFSDYQSISTLESNENDIKLFSQCYEKTTFDSDTFKDISLSMMVRGVPGSYVKEIAPTLTSGIVCIVFQENFAKLIKDKSWWYLNNNRCKEITIKFLLENMLMLNFINPEKFDIQPVSIHEYFESNDNKEFQEYIRKKFVGTSLWTLAKRSHLFGTLSEKDLFDLMFKNTETFLKHTNFTKFNSILHCFDLDITKDWVDEFNLYMMV
jgi:hypothetical protein